MGATGFTGATGATGFIGATGATGAGATGATGFQGATGAAKELYFGIVTTTPVTLTSANVNSIVFVDTSAARTINLPAGSGLNNADSFRFVDVGSSSPLSSGNAGSNNITITPNAADRISGGNVGESFIIDVNAASVKLSWCDATYDWRITAV